MGGKVTWRRQADFARAFGLNKAGRFAEAEAGYVANLTLQPEDTAALNNAAVVALQDGHPTLAGRVDSRHGALHQRPAQLDRHALLPAIRPAAPDSPLVILPPDTYPALFCEDSL